MDRSEIVTTSCVNADMVDVRAPRRSVFPSVLQAYDSGFEPTKRQSFLRAKSQSAVKNSKEVVKRNSAKVSVKKDAQTKNGAKAGSSASIKSLPNRNDHEIELKRRRAKRAEGMLKSWEALQQKERDEKYSFLKQRVKLQHDLIAKAGQLSGELRVKAEEKYQERILSRKLSRRETADALRAHINRIEEHKRMIAEKLKESDLSNQLDEPTTGTCADTPELSPKEQGSDNEPSESEVSTSNQSTQIDRKFDQTSGIENMWKSWKCDTYRKLEPVVQYSHQLKQLASPSVKQCLDIYEKPTVHDRYTGKPIPLTNILSEVSKTSPGDSQSYITGMMQQSARQNQKRAEILMSRKRVQLNIKAIQEPGWYGMNSEDPQLKLKPASAAEELNKPESKQRCRTSPQMKKKLPSFLRSTGDLVSGSLEEFGDTFYCGPSKDREDKAVDSIFLTDIQTENESTSLEDERNQDVYSRKQSFGWQPLSSGALAEHSRVTELPVQGLGQLAHGNYRMWRPIGSYVL